MCVLWNRLDGLTPGRTPGSAGGSAKRKAEFSSPSVSKKVDSPLSSKTRVSTNGAGDGVQYVLAASLVYRIAVDLL